MNTSLEIFRLAKQIQTLPITFDRLQDWHTRMFKWYGRGKAQDFLDIEVFIEAGKVFPAKPPPILYRGMNFPKGSFDPKIVDNTILLKLCSGVRSWSQSISGPKYYAKMCLTPRCISVVFVWHGPQFKDILMSGSRVDKEFKKAGLMDFFDTSEWIAKADTVQVLSKGMEKDLFVVHLG